MKYSLIILDEVYKELNESALYYEEQQFSLGEALLDEFESALIKIHVNPEGYEKKYKNFRQAMLNRFPYLVFCPSLVSSPILPKFDSCTSLLQP